MSLNYYNKAGANFDKIEEFNETWGILVLHLQIFKIVWPQPFVVDISVQLNKLHFLKLHQLSWSMTFSVLCIQNEFFLRSRYLCGGAAPPT